MRSRNIRINIVLAKTLMKACQKATGIKTRQELVNYALHEMLRHREQLKLLSLEGKIHWQGNEDVLGCTGYKGPKKSLKDMEKAIARGAKR